MDFTNDQLTMSNPVINSFICQLCDIYDDSKPFAFDQLRDLTFHAAQYHGSTRVALTGFWKDFESLPELRKYMKMFIDDFPICHLCWTLFQNVFERRKHNCSDFHDVQRTYDLCDMFSSLQDVAIKLDTAKNECNDADESSEDADEITETENGVKAENSAVELETQVTDVVTEGDNGEQAESGDESEEEIEVDDDDSDDSDYHPDEPLTDDSDSDKEYDPRNDLTSVRKTKKSVKKTMEKNDPEPEKDVVETMMEKNDDSDSKNEAEPENNEEKTIVAPTMNFLRKLTIPSNMCFICCKRFVSEDLRSIHVYENHRKQRETHLLKCEECKIGFGSLQSFKIHLSDEHSDDEAYFDSFSALIRLWNELSRTCEICGIPLSKRKKKFHTKSEHSELFIHKCEQCEESFLRNCDLKMHCFKVHQQPYLCPTCNKPFTKLKIFLMHLKREHQYQPMPFSYCFLHDKRCFRRPAFEYHLRCLHGKAQNTPKKEMPKKKKTSGTVLCDECGKIFSSSGSFAFHKTKHHLGKHKCKICDKSFECPIFVARHMVVHTGMKPYKCSICGLRVSQKSSLQRHMKVVHPDGLAKPGARISKMRRTRGPLIKKKKCSNVEAKVDSEETCSNTQTTDILTHSMLVPFDYRGMQY